MMVERTTGAALAGKNTSFEADHQLWPPLTYVEVKCHFTTEIVW